MPLTKASRKEGGIANRYTDCDCQLSEISGLAEDLG